jgi:CheY-like chemotaxis protein
MDTDLCFIETFGYTILTSASGGQGLELASMRPVDVMIVDYLMPEMNGQEVAGEIRRRKPQAPHHHAFRIPGCPRATPQSGVRCR